MEYCIQCTDQASGKVGCFGFDEERYAKERLFWAVTPVFPSLIEFYYWARENQIQLKH